MGVRVMNSQLHWIVYSFFFRLPLWLIIQKRRFRWKNTANDHEQIVLFKTKFNCSNNTFKPFQFISNVLRMFFQDGLSWRCNRISLGMKKAYFNIQSHFIQCRAEQCIASHCLCIWKTKLFGLKRAHISFEQKTFCFWLKFQKNLL